MMKQFNSKTAAMYGVTTRKFGGNAGMASRRRRKLSPVLLTATAAAVATVYHLTGTVALAANTPDVFSAGTSLATTTNWSLGTLPVITNDAEFGTALPAATKTLTGSLIATVVYGSLDDINTNGSVTVGDGTTVATAASLTLGGTGNLGNSISGTAADLIYTATGATLNLVPNTSTGTGILSIALGQAGIFDSVGTLSITAPISGSFGITTTGAGSVALGGTNTFTGGVNFSAGTLNINSTTALGAVGGTFQISGGTTLDNTSGAAVTTAANPVLVTSSGFTFKGSNALTLGGATNLSTPVTITTTASTFSFGGVLSGTGGSITKAGAGTLALGNANNTFTANIALNAGTLQVYGGASFGAAANMVTLGGNATIQFTSGTGVAGTGGEHGFNTGGYTLTLDPQASVVGLGNIISGTGGITKVGTGQIYLNTGDTYTGTTTINAGTLNFSSGSSVQSAGLAFGGGTLLFATGHTSSQSFNTTTFNAGANTIVIPAFSATSSSLALGMITRAAPATVDFTLPTVGTITTISPNISLPGGQASILGGYATVGGTTWATSVGGTITGLTTFDNTFAVPGADLDVIATVSQDPSVSAINSLRFNTAAPTTINVASGGLAIATGGILETAAVGANLSNISGGTLTSNNGQDLSIVQNNASAPLIITSNIIDSTAGSPTVVGLTKAGVGTVIIAGSNSNTGPTTIMGGTLQVGNGGTTETLGSGAVVDNGALAFNQSGTTTFPNAISGTGTLVQNGVGTLLLPIVTSYTGGTILNAGTLQFATTNDAGTGGFTFNGGTLRQTAVLSSGRVFTMQASGGTIAVSNGSTFTLTSATPIAGTGPLNVNNPLTSSTTGVPDIGILSISTLPSTFTGPVNVNAGQLMLTALVNTYAGSFTVNSGILYGYEATSFGTAPLTVGAGTVEINDHASTSNIASTLAGTLALTNAASTVQIGTTIYPNTVTIPTAVTGTGTLNKTGPGAIIFTNTTANNYSGGTVVNEGVLTSAVAGSYGTGYLTINPTFTAATALDNVNVNASTGSIATTAAVTVNSETADFNGSGVAFGIGTLNFTGAATIGSLAGNGLVTLNTNALTVGNATSTIFSGSMNGTGGSLIKAGTGTLTLSGSNSYTGGTNVSAGVLTFTNASAFPASSNLSIGSLGTVIASNVSAGTYALKINALSNTGLFDLKTNAAVIHTGSTLTMVNTQVQQGYNNGLWNGTNTSTGAIISSVAGADTNHLTAIGVIVNDNGSGTALYSSAGPLGTFAGSNPVDGDILVRYTYYGDANLDGKVDGSDYSRIDASFLSEQSGASISGWYNGDFNYDGVVNGSDYTLIDNAFNNQSGPLGSAIGSPLAVTTAEVASAVPEPATLGLLTMSTIGLLGSRRRRK